MKQSNVSAGVFLPLYRRLLPPLIALTALLFLSTFLFYDILRFRLMLIWNVFLAGLPLPFALLILWMDSASKSRLLSIPVWLAWLFLFPNAPYILTDFIHLYRYTFFDSYRFIPDPAAWFGFFHLSLGISTGLLWGMPSLYLLHKLMIKRAGGIGGWSFVAVIALLSGIAIQIGRFMRFNSWDILTRPFSLLARVWESLSPDTLALYGIFTCMTLMLYLPLYAFLEHRREPDGL